MNSHSRYHHRPCACGAALDDECPKCMRANPLGSMTMSDSKRAPTQQMWQVRMICCGRDEGVEGPFLTWDKADAFRESWTSGPGVQKHGYSGSEHESGHQRAGIIEIASQP